MSGLRITQCREQPLCSWCEAKIRKWTDTKRVWREDNPPTSREECQRRENQQVVHVSYAYDDVYDDAGNHSRVKVEPQRVVTYSVWDGESYVDDLFCSGTCETAYARYIARRIKEKPQ